MATARRTLVLVRHAKSAWPEGVADLRRPLAKRGRRDAPAAGRWLRDELSELDLIVCSPAERARQTCELLAAELGAAPDVRSEPRLYGDSAQGMLGVVRELPEQARTVAFIGHNPDIEELVSLLSGSDAPMRTCTIAVLEFEDDWQRAGPRCARLAEAHTPRGNAS